MFLSKIAKNLLVILFSFEPYAGLQRQVQHPWSPCSLARAQEAIYLQIRLGQKTLLNTTFYTFDSERYCMTFDNKSVRDMAANAPYDQIYILVNTKKYGGGAIYNYYSGQCQQQPSRLQNICS
ncbi:MAG: M64 family metallopeptidase [Marinilabiliales bacterium]|nr:M64 family metallopeptidase [Marinilabiliales bacterium]